MSLNKGEETQVENSHVGEKPRRGGCGRFLRKFWWAILIILAICALVIILPLVLVGFPRIIQDKVNSSTLHIDGISLTHTETDTALIQINSTVSSSNAIHATIDAFTAQMYLEDKLPHTPFASLQMPETKTGLAIVNLTQTINGTQLQPFIDFNSWYLWNESFPVTVEGETYVHVKGLKATKVTFKKTITLQGINGFKGLKVTSANITLEPDAQGDNFHGFADIPNVSILTLDIGNATFANYFNKTNIGTLYIDDMFIVPGINNVSLRANISQAPVLTALSTPPYCSTGILPFDLMGESVVNNGQQIPYFAGALALHAQSTSINVGAALEQTLGSQVAKCPS